VTNIPYIHVNTHTHRLDRIEGDNAIALCGQSFSKLLVDTEPQRFYSQCPKCRMEATRRMWVGQQKEATK